MLQPCVHIHLQRNWLAVMPQPAAATGFVYALPPAAALACTQACQQYVGIAASCLLHAAGCQ